MIPPLVVILFVILFVMVLGTTWFGLRFYENRRRKQVEQLLQGSEREEIPASTRLISEYEKANRISLAKILDRLSVSKSLSAALQQADLDWTVEKLVTMSLALGAAGALLGLKLTILLSPALSSLGLAAILAALPYLYVARKRSKRMSAFEEQFPEALDFLGRAMRAGHAFSVSLELLAEESQPPISTEFRKVFNEQNLGLPLDQALRNLAARVPMVDVNFFVSAVLLQRETGGNLAEILNKLSYVIRERFRLKGTVKATSASARMTGRVLTVLPVVLAFLLNMVNPGYLQMMTNDPHGRMMILGAVLLQVIGYLVIRKIVDIKV